MIHSPDSPPRGDDKSPVAGRAWLPSAARAGAAGGALWGGLTGLYGGDVIHSSLSEHGEETLQEALRDKTTA